MNQRQAVISELENVRKYANDPLLIISDGERKKINESIDISARYAQYGRYHVTALGVFSTGKSTLLNAMLGAGYLPSADLPTTAITTEIYAASFSSFFIPLNNAPENVARDFKECLESHFRDDGISFIDYIERDGEKVAGLGGKFSKSSSQIFSKIIRELTDQQQRNTAPFLELKKILSKEHNLTLWLGIEDLPEWLQDIVLTDAPGTGSIEDSHEIVINKIIPESQLVLYLIEAEKAGSAIDKSFSDRVSNSYHRKMFYVLNKIDRQTSDDLLDAIDAAKRSVPEVKSKDAVPEFLTVSGLYAYTSMALKSGEMTLDEVCDGSKVNLSKLLVSREWRQCPENGQTALASSFLFEKSNYEALQKRIEDYLKHENKELAIVQQAQNCILNTATIIIANCQNAINVLRSDKSIEELKAKSEECHSRRESYARDAKRIITEFRNSLKDRNTGVATTIRGMLSGAPNEITSKLATALQNDYTYNEFKKDQDGWLKKWLTKELSALSDDVKVKLLTYLEKNYQGLANNLRPIIGKLGKCTLGETIIDIDGNSLNQSDFDISPTGQATAITAGGIATGTAVGGLAFLVGAASITTTSTVFVPATGAAAWPVIGGLMASLGFGTAATTTTVATTSAPMLFGLTCFPVLAIAGAVGLAAAAIIVYMRFGNIKDWKIKKITEKVNNLLNIVILDGGEIEGQHHESLAAEQNKRITEFIDVTTHKIEDQLDECLRQLDETEQDLLKQVSLHTEERERRCRAIEKIAKEVNVLKDNALTVLAKC